MVFRADKIVIDLDFGMTYSGIKYLFTGGEKKLELEVVTEWRGVTGANQSRVPTLVLCDQIVASLLSVAL